MKTPKRIEFGQYVVSDLEICHGNLTYKGTRVLVRDVIECLAAGKSWDWISDGYHGLPMEAIAETISLAGDALIEKAKEMRPDKKAQERRVARYIRPNQREIIL